MPRNKINNINNINNNATKNIKLKNVITKLPHPIISINTSLKPALFLLWLSSDCLEQGIFNINLTSFKSKD